MIITCRKQIPSRWIGFVILPWASFTLNFAVVGAAFIFSVKKFVDNPAGVAFILSLPGFLAIIAAPLSSFLSDRIWTRFGRRKPFVVSGGIGSVIALIAMPIAPNFWTLVAAYILYHLSDGLSAPRDPLKQEIVPPHERGRATGAMSWCQNLATVIFYSVMLGRFDDVSYLAGFPLHGETVIYWSAALLLAAMMLLVTLGIKEIDQKSALVGERLSIRNFVGGLLDRELWPVYLIVLSFGLLNFFSGFGPFLSTLLYTDQWGYTKQEMGMNVAIGGVVNLFIIGLLTLFADRLPRMRAFRTLICLSLAWNAAYYCYVNFVLPDQRPTLIEIILFGEVLSIISVLISLVYTPLIYDYVRRNKMGTFAAGAQIANRGTQLFTLNGVGLFVWAYATVFQPPAGEMTRVVLRDTTDKAALVSSLRTMPWLYPETKTPVPASAISATAWQADGVAAKTGHTWEIRLRNKTSEALADEKKKLEQIRSLILADEKRFLDEAAAAHAHGTADEATRLTDLASRKKIESEKLSTRIAAIESELTARAGQLRAQVATALGPRLIAEGEQIIAAEVQPAIVLELATTERPDGKVIERLLDDLRRDFPLLIDLRPLKRATGYGLTASAIAEAGKNSESLSVRLQTAIEQAAARWAPGLLVANQYMPEHHLESALAIEVQTVEQPVSNYVSPVTRAVNAVLALFDRVPSPTRRLSAVARSLRVAGETNHVRVTAGSGDRTIIVTALLQSSASQVAANDNAIGRRLRSLLGAEADDTKLGRAHAFYNRIETIAATQRLTVAHPILAAAYVPLKYDYMGGYLWVFFVGLIGVGLTLIFGRLEARGVIGKRGIEEARES